jgi:ADP-ribose pyrophosphatase
MYTAPGFCDEVIHLFLARDLSSGAQSLDDNEFLAPHAIPLTRVREMAANGELDDSKSIVALYRAMPHLASAR